MTATQTNYGFTVTPSQARANQRRERDVKLARKAAKARARAEREARTAEVAKAPAPVADRAPVVVETSNTRVLTDAEREESRLRAEAEVLAAKTVIETGIDVVKTAPKQTSIPADVLAAGLAADIARTKRDAERKAAKEAASKPIPAEVLAAGLEADRNAEAKRAEEEAAWQRLLTDGYKKDVHATAMQIATSNLHIDEKVKTLIEVGFAHVGDGKTGRDAEYFHAKSGVRFFLKGAGIGTQEVVRPHKARGCELLPPMTAEQHEANRLKKEAAKAAAKAGRGPKLTQAQIDKAAKKAAAKAKADEKAARKNKK